VRLPKPTRIRLLALGLAAAQLYLLTAALVLRPPPPGATLANFQRIEPGMPEAKVEEILGGPGRLVATLARQPEVTWKKAGHSSFKDASFLWIEVEYRYGVVSQKFVGPGQGSRRPKLHERRRAPLGL
jgi:hypothetical protein